MEDFGVINPTPGLNPGVVTLILAYSIDKALLFCYTSQNNFYPSKYLLKILMQEREWSVVSERLEDRFKSIYCLFYDFLGDLWEEHFKTRTPFFKTHTSTFSLLFDEEFFDYQGKLFQFVLALEFLRKLRPTLSLGIFDNGGRLASNLNKKDLETIVKNQGLEDLRIGVFGGPEGRVFAALGAQAVNIDPLINKAPGLNLTNLSELPITIREAQAQLPQNFDLTFSARVFDNGSGLVMPNFSNYDEWVAGWADYLRSILQMTRVGGFSIHDGNMMPKIVGRVQDLAQVVEIGLPYSNNKIGDSDVIFVLQRK